jgi:hypothetical protein
MFRHNVDQDFQIFLVIPFLVFDHNQSMLTFSDTASLLRYFCQKEDKDNVVPNDMDIDSMKTDKVRSESLFLCLAYGSNLSTVVLVCPLQRNQI